LLLQDPTSTISIIEWSPEEYRHDRDVIFDILHDVTWNMADKLVIKGLHGKLHRTA